MENQVRHARMVHSQPHLDGSDLLKIADKDAGVADGIIQERGCAGGSLLDWNDAGYVQTDNRADVEGDWAARIDIVAQANDVRAQVKRRIAGLIYCVGAAGKI